VDDGGGPSRRIGHGAAVIYGLLASSSFVVGVLLGLVTNPPRRLLAVIIAFGARGAGLGPHL
jgi:hypothetical protein